MVGLLVNSLARGGAEKIVLYIAKGLAENNQDVTIICLVRQNDYPIPEGLKINYLSNLYKYEKGFKPSKILLFPVMVFRLRKLIRGKNIHIVQSHLFSASIFNVIAGLLGCKHSIQIVNHSQINYEKINKYTGYIKIAILRFIYQRADLLISISRQMMDYINDHILNKSDVNHIVIYNPHDIRGITGKMDETVKELKFLKGKKYIITAGRLIKSKRIDMLICAFSDIRNYYPEYELIILGDGAEYNSLVKLSGDLKIKDKVHFVGFVDNPYKFISRSDIFVMASESEGLPNAIIEAMACGTPVISTDCRTGPRELLAPETDYNKILKDTMEVADFGILVPVGDVALLTEAIKHVIENYSTFKNKAGLAIDFVQKFSVENSMVKYLECFSLKHSNHAG